MFGFLIVCTLACGLIGYLHWFLEGVRRPKSPQALDQVGNDNSDLVAEVEPACSRPSLDRYKQLLPFIVGTLLAGFFFVLTLSGYLSRENRPTMPEAALGYTYFVKVKFGSVYGTFFEYLAITYGIWLCWAGLLIAGVVGKTLGITINDGSLAFPLRLFTGAATAMLVYYLLWQISLFPASS
jgi:hypothetical protein